MYLIHVSTVSSFCVQVQYDRVNFFLFFRDLLYSHYSIFFQTFLHFKKTLEIWVSHTVLMVCCSTYNKYTFLEFLHGTCISLTVFLCVEVASEWTEETVNLCLQLFISLLPLNHKLLKE